MLDNFDQTQNGASRAVETVFADLGDVYKFIMAHTPHSAAREQALNQLTEVLGQTRDLKGMVDETGGQLRAVVAMLMTANQQLEQQLRYYYTLENAVDEGDESHELVAALIQRIREDDDVVASDDVWDIVAEALADTLKENGITTGQVKAFLEGIQYDELPPEAAEYLAQLIAYAQQRA